MAKAYSNTIGNRKQTVQTQPIPGRESEMVKNNAGGYVFNTSDDATLDRFLILGTEGGTYYQSEKQLTEQAAQKVKDIIKKDGVKAINRATEISHKGLAQKNSAVLFAFALASAYGDEKTKNAVKENLSKVCRTGSHILEFVNYCNSLRGMGRSVRTAINSWYTEKDVDSLALQVCKYQNRNSWKHSDVFRLTHPKFSKTLNDKVVKWVMNKETKAKQADLIVGFEKAKAAKSVSELLNIITDYKLPRECIPTQFLNDVAVWEALLDHMPMTAMIRNLGKMSSCGLLSNTPFNKNVVKVLEKLSDKEAIRKGRIHPLSILMALKTYSSGHGFRGSNTWNVNSSIVNGLDEAFYLAFEYLEPTNKRILYACDVSGSMRSSISGSNISCAEAVAALSMALARTEKNYYIMGFAHSFVDLNISAKDKLDQALRKVQLSNFGSTNCALPFTWGKDNKVDFDMAVVLTDNETYNGGIHVTQAINQYRSARNLPNTKMACVGMTATNFTIADPNDPRQIDIAGLSADLPKVISSFAMLGDKIERSGKNSVQEDDSED